MFNKCEFEFFVISKFESKKKLICTQLLDIWGSENPFSAFFAFFEALNWWIQTGNVCLRAFCWNSHFNCCNNWKTKQIFYNICDCLQRFWCHLFLLQGSPFRFFANAGIRKWLYETRKVSGTSSLPFLVAKIFWKFSPCIPTTAPLFQKRFLEM